MLKKVNKKSPVIKLGFLTKTNDYETIGVNVMN